MESLNWLRVFIIVEDDRIFREAAGGEEGTEEDSTVEDISSSDKRVATTQPKPKAVKWVRREIKDCQKDLADLSLNMLEQLKIRKQQCLPDLMGILHSCLDFGSHFNDLCGVKIGTRIPIKKSSFATRSRDEFDDVWDMSLSFLMLLK